MKLGLRELVVAGVAVAVAVGAILAAWADAVTVAVAALGLLAVGSIGMQVLALRHVVLRQQSLDRIEKKLDVVARRVVTESEATNRELAGRIDELVAEIRRDV